ncbi:MAG: dihydrolipoyl dehydrogenase [Lentisphaerae bacterium]|nr:dihydrolipoyl dehydrogenase [Lentisphaerota bacterium]
MDKFDVVVMGAGPGGYPAAIRAAQLGASVAIVEREKLGGTCLNWGCIPTKTLIASSELFHAARRGEALGIKAGKLEYDYAAMAKRKDEVVATLNRGVEQLLKANGVKIFEGTASFDAPTRVNIAPAGEGRDTRIEGGTVIIATGSASAVPGFLPKHRRVVESRAFLDLTALPSSLLVLGGGVIGCEFACMAAQLGAEVTVVEMLDDILAMLDSDVRRELRRHMEQDLGIRVLTGKPLENIEASASGVSGKAGETELKADMLLVSVGRRPVTDGLALDRAGLSVNERGFIAVDAACRTRNASVFAIGDVTAGSTLLAHAATAQGVTAAENAVLKTRKPAGSLVPSCIFTSPEIGAVGITEQQARDAGRKVSVGKFGFAGLGKALASGEPNGFVKLIADSETDQLLGAHAVGPHATDLIGEAALAIHGEFTAEELGRVIHAHPTFAESWMEAAHALHGACIHAAPKRRK